MNSSSAVTKIAGTALPMTGNDIDTDRIIPARFLRSVTFDGLGDQVFKDERFDDEGNRLDHPFNDGRFTGAAILLVNANFGCGSSREHAPQAIMRSGIGAIIGQSFAEIFAGNCTNLGIPVLTAEQAVIEKLQQLADSSPNTEFELDIGKAQLTVAGESYELAITESSQKALLEGTWDSLGELLKDEQPIEQIYSALPYTRNFQE
jgi:3-isopropylmalate/(R)-2-methylmalate dehydratase small subunit